FMNYMNVLSDFEIRLKTLCPVNVYDEEMNRLSESIENKDHLIRELQEKLTKLEKKAGATGRKRVTPKKKTASAAAVKKAAPVKKSPEKKSPAKAATKKSAAKGTAVRKKAGSK
ncbi:MAG: alpha-amylase, partial [Bacteroidales bacterium]|nr:alpha-amylase [Bacteroidales bacterium]